MTTLAPGLAGLGAQPEFSGKTLEEALAWRLVWLLAPRLGIAPFVI